VVGRLALPALTRHARVSVSSPILSAALAAALLTLSATAGAHDYRVGALRIVHPYATPSPPGLDAAAVYLAVENRGAQADRLLGASTDAARVTALHSMALEDGVMRMRRVDGIEIAARATVALAPGVGHHIMLEGLAAPLRAGDRLVLRLHFLQAGETSVSVWVQARADGAAATDAHLKPH